MLFRGSHAARAAALALAAAALAAAPAAAQDTLGVRLRLQYQPQDAPGLVVLPFAGGSGAGPAAQAARVIVRQDLDFSNRFAVREPTGATAGQPVDAAAWRERGADWVLDGRVDLRAGGLTLRLTLHDAVYGQVRAQQAFELPAAGSPGFRMAVHAASDAVVRWVTGQDGIAATRIAYVVQGRGSKEIHLVDWDGENVTRVTDDGSIALSPAWSPDGRRLAYTSFRTEGPRLYERELATGRDRLLSDRDGLNITPGYAPDGRTVAFATTVAGNTEIATLGGGDGLRQHTRSRRFDNVSPVFSPDGGRIAFVSDRLGTPGIFVMELGGGEPRLISDYRVYSTSPDWSPKGQQVAFHARVGGVHQIVVADAARGGTRLLTDRGRNEDPSWAPDGRHLVFASPDRDGGGLFVLDTETGRIRPLLRGRGYGLPAWSPVLLRYAASPAAPR